MVKDYKDEKPYVGSITFERSEFINIETASCQMWVTLFEDQGDDIFDGTLGIDDCEDPRVLLQFNIE